MEAGQGWKQKRDNGQGAATAAARIAREFVMSAAAAAAAPEPARQNLRSNN